MIGHLDCFAGVAGDMLLGAVLDAGARLEAAQDAIDALDLGPVRIEPATVRRGGLRGTAVTIAAGDAVPPLRTLPAITGLLEKARLASGVRDRALAVFARLARAEADVHGIAADEVHFHEVGAVDTLADVVGVCAAVADLGIESMTCGVVVTGTGTVRSAHGTLPVPAPAVVELLRGFPVAGGDVAAELTTPTGAALLAELAEPVPSLPPMTVVAAGYGAGSRDLPVPNLVRLVVGHAAAGTSGEVVEDLVEVEATVDDLSGELVPVVLDRLREAGARDAWAVPAVMKKGRPGVTLTALAGPSELDAVQAVLFTESTTLGLRWHAVRRRALARLWTTVAVDGQPVRVKIGLYDGSVVTVAPEADDVRAAAARTGLPARAVHERAVALARSDAVGPASELVADDPRAGDQ